MNADSDQAVADNADSVETQLKEEPNDSEKLKGFLKKAEEAVTKASMNKGAESKGIEVATVKFLTEQADQVRVALDAEVGALEIQIKSANKKNKPKLETELTNTKLKINKFNTDQVELKKKTLKALRGEEQERIKGSKAKVEAERQAVDAEKFDLASAKEKSKAGSTPSDETLKAEFEKEKAKKLASLEIQDKNLDEYSAGVTGRETSLDAELNDKTKLLEAEAAKLKNTANTDPATKSVGAAPGASANIQTPKKPAAGVGTKVKERFVKAKNKFKGLFSRKKKAATADSNDAEGTEEKVVGNNVEVEVAEPVGAAAPAKSIKKEIKTIKSATDKQIKTLMAETSGKELEDAIKKYVDDQTEKVRTTLNAEVAELEEQAGKATSQDDLGKLNKKLKTARSNLDDFDGKQKTLKLEAVEAVAAEEKAAIKKQKSDIEKQIKKLETEKTEASKIKGTAAGEAKAQQIMLDAENKIASLKGQSGTLDREVEAIDKRVAASKETIDTEAGALKQQETEKAQKRKTETDEAIKVATSTVGGVAADTEETSSALEKLRKKVSGAGAEVQKSAEKKIKQAAENFEASEKAVTKLKADIENAGSDVKKVATLSKQLEAETTKRNKLAGQLSDLEAETAKNSVSAVKKAAEQEQADIQKQISELEKTKAKTLAGSGLDDLVNQKSKQLADQEDIGNKQKISSLQEKLKGLGAIVNNADGISKNMNLSPLERLAAATADTEATRFGSATGTKKIGGSSSATSMEALKRAALAPEIEQRKERVKQVSALRKRTAQLSTATQESVGKITAAATIKRAWKKHRGPVGIEEITKTRRSARNVIDDATGQIRRTKSFSSGSTGNDSDGPIRRTRSFSGTAKDRVRLGGAANETARPMRGPDIERVRK
ncbi:hypothetical protein HOD08_04300 [bacterium]|nr:hypothetical protein [bacterium]